MRDVAGFDALEEVVRDEPAGIRLGVQAGAELSGGDVGFVAGLHQAPAVGVVGPGPALAAVVIVAEGVERLVMAGRGDVQALAGRKLHAGVEQVEMATAVLFPVEDGGPDVAVRVQAGEGGPFERIEHRLDLSVGGPVLRRPGDHAGGVPVLEVQSVRDGGDPEGIPAQDLHVRPRVPLGVPFADEVLGGLPGVAGAALQELNVHRRPRPGPSRVPARWRSGAR